jgi:hypothetical protein
MHADGGKLHVRCKDKISLFRPLTKEFILLEAPQKVSKGAARRISHYLFIYLFIYLPTQQL